MKGEGARVYKKKLFKKKPMKKPKDLIIIHTHTHTQ